MRKIIIILFILIFSSFAFGASFVVNNNSDTSDANLSDNLCLDANGNCTLRAAVEQANSSASDDVITFAAGLQTITLTSGNEIPIINAGTLQINGPGANVLTINGGLSFNRIFNTNNATVIIADVTLTDGGQRSVNNFNGTEKGGAILVNSGALTIQRVYFTGNSAGGSAILGNSGSGGGVYFVGGTHNVLNSTFYDNYSNGGGGGVNIESGVVTIVNSTFSENTGTVWGGAIYNSGSLILRNTTITKNICRKAPGLFNRGFGGGIANVGGILEINNTIVAGNVAENTTGGTQPSIPEIYFSGGSITSTGNNFIGDSADDSTSTGTPIAYQPTDIRDIPPLLASALADNGGTTPTRALLAGSPAIDAGNTNAAPTDQRGAPRVGAPDIGAYEFSGLTFSISGRVTSDGTNGLSGVTVTLSGSSSATVITDANGNYTFTGLIESGNYTVTPTLANTVFSPSNATFNNLSGNQIVNFRPQCAYSIDPTSISIPASGGSISINVTASAGCSWTAASNVAFITVTNGTGTGSGTATFNVQANTGTVRTGTLTIAGQTVTVTQAALPTLSINNFSLFEGNSGTTPFVFTVTLSATSNQTVTINYTTVNGTATPPSDYQATSGSLSFAPGETSKTIIILVNGDTTVEPNETFTVNLSGAMNATIAIGQGTGTILNDDGTNATRKLFDFDGDGKADLTVFRPSNGFWYELRTQNNSFYALQFGQSSDKLAPADYDGDGRTDIAVFRENVPGAGDKAYFYITNSSDNSFRFAQFGTQGDVPMSGDWDGDGIADLAVYRNASTVGGQSYFFYRPSSQSGVDFRTIAWGTAGDKPVMGDFDGDGKLDAAVFRPSNGVWYILQSSNNQFIQQPFGFPTDILVPADYDGDGKTNIAVFRPSTGYWYTSTDASIGYGGVQFGSQGDVPVPADYDGDWRADIAVFRPSNGVWYLLRSTAGFTGVQFGAAEDKPIPNIYIR